MQSVIATVCKTVYLNFLYIQIVFNCNNDSHIKGEAFAWAWKGADLEYCYAMTLHNITCYVMSIYLFSREINLAFSLLRSVSLPWNFSGKCKVIRLGKHLFSWHRMTHLLRLLPALVLHIDAFGWRPGHFQSSTSVITCGDVVYARETTFVSVALFSPDNKLQIFFFCSVFWFFIRGWKTKLYKSIKA